MDQILERYKLPKLPQGEIDYLNSSVSIKDIKLIVYIKNKQYHHHHQKPSRKETQTQMVTLVNFTK